jgi:hypothetical protein
MCFGCICGDSHTGRPWWPTEQRWDVPSEKTVRTDCCYRRLPASETITQLRCQEVPEGGYGDYQEIDPWPSTIYENGEPVGQERKRVNWFSYVSYYDPTWRVECNPEGERSCKTHRRFLRGLHLREPV